MHPVSLPAPLVPRVAVLWPGHLRPSPFVVPQLCPLRGHASPFPSPISSIFRLSPVCSFTRPAAAVSPLRRGSFLIASRCVAAGSFLARGSVAGLCGEVSLLRVPGVHFVATLRRWVEWSGRCRCRGGWPGTRGVIRATSVSTFHIPGTHPHCPPDSSHFRSDAGRFVVHVQGESAPAARSRGCVPEAGESGADGKAPKPTRKWH